ncbi:hypothetical protein SAY87_011369 [Trapa incisa]|uniref:Uncharacterized protein n=1 Tax=Trapa incisa TaxID=236973 RepID=A0AAN7JIR2_9MYRT|nr:hypothetical protein SAY87_011369 [Trapa incisa]
MLPYGCSMPFVLSIGSSAFNDDQHRLASYASLFYPLRKATYKDKKAKEVPCSSISYVSVSWDSFVKFTWMIYKVIGIQTSAERFLELIPFIESNLCGDPDSLDLNDEFVDVPASSKVLELKPLVNGKDIMNALQLNAGGPLVREWKQRTLALQLANPTGSPEECLDWMREIHQKRVKLERNDVSP